MLDCLFVCFGYVLFLHLFFQDALQVLFLHQALGLSLSDKLLNFVN